MFTQEELKARREQRKTERRLQNALADIEREKHQKEVKTLTISIQWVKSRTWGNNPHATAEVSFKDGTFERRDGFTCSGCGYDKESTVIAEIFNAFLKYKLYQKRTFNNRYQHGSKYPYGVYYYEGIYPLETYQDREDKTVQYYKKPSYRGGVGTSCYTNGIAEFIGGKFESIASGKTFDIYRYTDNE